MDIRETLRGSACPLVTPVADGAVEADALASLIDHVEAGGVDAVVPCGTTGEFASLSSGERTRVIERTVADATVPVVAGTAAPNVAAAIERAETAARAGADAVMIPPPYFHTATEPAGNRRFFERVADRVSVPIVLYNIPACTGREIAPETVAALADHERIVGIKDSSGDLEYHLALERATPAAFVVLQGYDALLVPALRMGSDGGINALANVVPELFADLVADPTSGRARRLQTAISPLFECCTEYGFAPVTKAALVHRGVLEDDAVRPPLTAVDDAIRAEIADAVTRALAAGDRE